MKKYFIACALIGLLISCISKIKNNSNIQITNNDLLELLRDFKRSSSQIGLRKNNVISVSIGVSLGDTTIGLYAYKKLKPEYFIGYLKIDSSDIFFYTDIKPIDGLYRILSPPKIAVKSEWDYTETYMESFKYTKGKIIFLPPPSIPNCNKK